MSALNPTNYSFRHKIPGEVTQPSRKVRKILGPNDSPSLFHQEKHDCSAIICENTAIKVEARLVFSAFRFAMASAWQCHTYRETIAYNGSQSHCKQKCQAAHAALSGALGDDQLNTIVEQLKKKSLCELSEADQTYFRARFPLSKKFEQDLQSEKEEIRLQSLQIILKTLGGRELRGTFLDTEIEKIRNATFANPTASNRIDCFLEATLRKLEDELAQLCVVKKIDLTEAMKNLHQKYQSLLAEVHPRLSKDLTHLENLENAFNKLLKQQEELLALAIKLGDFVHPNVKSTEGSFAPEVDESTKNALEKEKIQKTTSYLKSVEEYLRCFDERFKGAGQGVPKFDTFEKALKGAQSLSVLKSLLGKKTSAPSSQALLNKEDSSIVYQTFLSYQSHLKSIDISTQVQEAKDEVHRRIDEVTAQQNVISNDFEKIHQLINLTFEQKNEKGEPRTPTQKELQQQFYSYIRPLTPSRSDIFRTLKTNKENATNMEIDQSGPSKLLPMTSLVEKLS